MKADIIKLPKSEIELKIEVPAQEWQEFLDEAAKELSRDLKIEGFRPGYAPLKLVEEKIGIARILETAAERCVRKCYVRAVLENNIEAIGQPEISILKLAKGNPFEFKAKVAVIPEIKLPDYKKIASGVKRNKVLVEEREIEEAFLWLQKSRAKFSLKPGPCQKGDWVEIEYSSSQIEQGNKRNDAFILGEGKLVPGFEENLEGMTAEQEKEFSLTFPKNHFPKDLSGKKIDFTMKLKSVQSMELPEVNDQFAQNLGNFQNLAALKKSLKEGINLEKEKEESQKVRQNILEKISQNSETETPEILVARIKTQMLEDLKQNISQNLGITFEDYFNKIKKTEKELLDSFSSAAIKRVKDSLILKEISKKENIAVSDQEIKAEIDEILKKYTNIKGVDSGKLKDYTEEALKNEKTLQFLENFTRKP